MIPVLQLIVFVILVLWALSKLDRDQQHKELLRAIKGEKEPIRQPSIGLSGWIKGVFASIFFALLFGLPAYFIFLVLTGGHHQ